MILCRQNSIENASFSDKSEKKVFCILQLKSKPIPVYCTFVFMKDNTVVY